MHHDFQCSGTTLLKIPATTGLEKLSKTTFVKRARLPGSFINNNNNITFITNSVTINIFTKADQSTLVGYFRTERNIRDNLNNELSWTFK